MNKNEMAMAMVLNMQVKSDDWGTIALDRRGAHSTLLNINLTWMYQHTCIVELEESSNKIATGEKAKGYISMLVKRARSQIYWMQYISNEK